MRDEGRVLLRVLEQGPERRLFRGPGRVLFWVLGQGPARPLVRGLER
ncbi:MAG: hypothetical protein NTX53_15720 [candidate division WOR-3 bacterium]|nr:hypothetical protein [candidate division WOR-3 bacterium]